MPFVGRSDLLQRISCRRPGSNFLLDFFVFDVQSEGSFLDQRLQRSMGLENRRAGAHTRGMAIFIPNSS